PTSSASEWYRSSSKKNAPRLLRRPDPPRWVGGVRDRRGVALGGRPPEETEAGALVLLDVCGVYVRGSGAQRRGGRSHQGAARACGGERGIEGADRGRDHDAGGAAGRDGEVPVADAAAPAGVEGDGRDGVRHGRAARRGGQAVTVPRIAKWEERRCRVRTTR